MNRPIACTLVVLTLLLCSFSASHSQITADAGPDLNICTGDTAFITGNVVNGGPFSVVSNWTTNSPVSLTNTMGLNPTLVGAPAGCWEVYLELFDFFSGFLDADTMVVCVEERPLAQVGTMNTSICPPPSPGLLLNGSVTNVPGPFTYTWVPAAGLNDSTVLNPFARPDTTTTYTFYATSPNGCRSIPFLNLSEVTIEVLPLPIADAGSDVSICEGDSIPLNGIGLGAGPNYSYNWSPTQHLSDPFISNPIAFPSSSTYFELTVFSNGCPSFSDSLFITVNPLPLVPTIFVSGDSLISSPAGTYQWCRNGTAIPGATNQWYIPVQGGDYQVKVTEGSNCELTSDVLTSISSGVLSGVSVWPNPAYRGQFSIHLPPSHSPFIVKLFHPDGRLIWEKSSSQQKIQVEPDLEKGLYILRIQGFNGLATKKIVIN